MRTMTRLFRSLALFSLPFVLASTPQVSVQAVDSYNLSGDLNGGTNVSHVATTEDILSWYRIQPVVDNWGDGLGLSFRIKNNITSGGGSPIHIAINEKDSDRVQPNYNGGANLVSYYPLVGETTQSALRNFDSAVILPANFDGHMFIPFTAFSYVGTSFGNGQFNLADIFAIYVGINTKYDAFSNYDLGDLELVKSDLSVSPILDLQTIQPGDFGNRIISDYNGINVVFNRLEGVDSVQVDLDYATADLLGDLSLGANLSYLPNNDMSAFSVAKIKPTDTNFGGSEAVSIRVKNNTNINTPIDFSVHESSGEMFTINKTLGDVYYKSLEGIVSTNAFRAWDSRLVIPASFDGFLVVPFTSLGLLGSQVNDGVLDQSIIYAFFLGVSNYKDWDAFANYQIGDIEAIDGDGLVTMKTNMAALTSAEFELVFVKEVNIADMLINRLPDLDQPPLANRFGDVKVLEDFNYETTAEIQSNYPVWSGGSTINNSLQDGAMRVDIGGVISGNNIYGSIDIFPKPKVSDWTVWNDGGVNADQAAQGVTFYVKNLSAREITINLEFEEKTGDIYERWNIKYGAMIMLHDVSGDEFIVHAKPVLAIPVGFEGWVRIDFSQYWVPSWCTWGDLQLDLTQPITGFFLTTDTTKNEGLSYLIDDIGVYYNKTVVSSLFYTPENSFAANMADGE